MSTGQGRGLTYPSVCTFFIEVKDNGLLDYIAEYDP
jgi:hypothetical protein